MKRTGSAWHIALVALTLVLSAVPLAAQDVNQQIRDLRERVEILELKVQRQDSVETANLKRQIDLLSREIQRLQRARSAAAAGAATNGLGPGASKVYRTPEGVSIGGYGEVAYQDFATDREDGTAAGLPARADALVATAYVGYRFDRRILVNSAIAVRHASTAAAGAVSMEFMYLDLMLDPAFGLRGGLLLLPMGFLNEQHEPPTYLGVMRPETEQRILPTPWSENGVGFFGSVAGLSYRAYLVNGLDGAGFSAAGLQGGRQQGSEALAQTGAAVARVDYRALPGFSLGGSAYFGNAGQGREQAGRRVQARTLIWEGHGALQAYGLDLRALLAVATLTDADALDALNGLYGAATVGQRLVGGYAQAGLNVLRYARTPDQLIPYVRYERINTQDQVPAGFAADPANDDQILTFGLEWKPIDRIVLKADYQRRHTAADTGVPQFNVALGYVF